LFLTVTLARSSPHRWLMKRRAQHATEPLRDPDLHLA
jgi:hypothetical protein